MPYRNHPLVLFYKEHRIGLLILLSTVFLFEFSVFFIHSNLPDHSTKYDNAWLSSPLELNEKSPDSGYTMNRFNPNFITDYKAYKLGMTVEEVNRLFAYRKLGKYVNSPTEFQQVTKISDKLLHSIEPYFKFPEWTQKKSKISTVIDDTSKSTQTANAKVKAKKDINKATKEELMDVYGIGDKLSDRILNFRAKLGGFVSITQLEDVWGLNPEVISEIQQQFDVISFPEVKKIKINEASVKELESFPYFRYPISKKIVVYRSMNGSIHENDLTKFIETSNDRIKIIALYLEF